jgi:hypothetical protein
LTLRKGLQPSLTPYAGSRRASSVLGPSMRCKADAPRRCIKRAVRRCQLPTRCTRSGSCSGSLCHLCCRRLPGSTGQLWSPDLRPAVSTPTLATPLSGRGRPRRVSAMVETWGGPAAWALGLDAAQWEAKARGREHGDGRIIGRRLTRGKGHQRRPGRATTHTSVFVPVMK